MARHLPVSHDRSRSQRGGRFAPPSFSRSPARRLPERPLAERARFPSSLSTDAPIARQPVTLENPTTGRARNRSHSRSSLTPFLALLVLPIAIGVAVYRFGIPLEPDASYYVGGLSLFPSPLGTLLGTAGGYSGLALLNAFAAFAIILLVGLIARDLGGHALAGPDPRVADRTRRMVHELGNGQPGGGAAVGRCAAALPGALTVGDRPCWPSRGNSPGSSAAGSWSLGVHARRRGVVAITVGLAAAGFLVAWFTGYRAGFRLLHEPGALVEGAHELLLACWPLAILACVATFHPRVRLLFVGSAVGAILAGAIPASVGQLGLTRYAIPCVFIAVAGVRLRGSLGAARGTAPAPSSVGTVSAREESGFTLSSS